MSLSIQEINHMYNQTNKDMPRHEFIKEMQRLTNQSETNKDLQKIMMRKRMASRERQKIDRAVENGR